jgi:EAL domain-containing protein (putative c-di-GMP-specific phosphodiesterase class I)/GGDEF domain-containing protein
LRSRTTSHLHDERAAARSVVRLADVGFLLSFLVALAAVTVAALPGLFPGVTVPPPSPVAAVATVVALGVGLLVQARRIRRRLAAVDRARHGLREAYDRARLDSLRDGLTGLGNHRAFQEELDLQLAIARDEDGPLALLIVDVEIVTANLRRGDRAYRTGGDEFALLLPGCDADAAEVVANHLLAAALNGNHGRSGPFSITVGISAYPSPSVDRQQMIHHADAALYAGKRRGRTNVQRFDPAVHGIANDARSLNELEVAVQGVVGAATLRPVYQPIFSLETGEVIGYEGLVRLAPDSGFDSPASLFVAAEATRRTVELDIVCARTVLAGATGLEPHQYLSINLSPRTLESDAFSPLEILARARDRSIPPGQLVVELTEREAIEDLGRLQRAIATLRRHEVRIAIDDVGSGNAGLRLLSEVEFDTMKIDLSLVRAGATHEPTEAVLRALGAFARERGHTIVAEGIESAELLESVLELHYDAGQGYLLGRPEPALVHEAADLIDLLGQTPAFFDPYAA